MSLGFVYSWLTVTIQKANTCNNILCYLRRQEVMLMKLWNSNTWTNTLNLLLYRECCKTSFICCFLMTAKNLIWLVLFLFFCSWWPTEEYLLAVLNIMCLLSALRSSKLLQRSSPNPTTVSLYLSWISDTIQQTNL